jgi:RHS repeat-associated protein
MWNIISGFDTLITDYYYNSQDQVTDYSHTGKGEKISYRNSYDYAGRLDSVDKYDIPDIPNPDFINLAAYSYNPNSQVLQNDLNDGNIRLYYYYNNRGWISEMFDNNGFLDYTNDYFKNGNVKSQQISGNYNDNFTVSTDLSYTYGYDKSNRLLTSENADKIYDLTNSYDKDGNILSLVRTNGIGSVSDDFSYAYYSGTNKLQRVIGAGSQFSYDANGNLIQDAFNNNNEILYDYRNLITELKHRSQIIGDTVYLTKYYYDEAGNRIRKMTYAYLQPVSESEPPANSDVSNTSNWALRNDEVYSRDVSGKEMAIYQNNSLLEYPTYGLDMIGKIKDDELHFYLKDHLGSIRATVYDNKLISAQDYDAWGYILEGRTYESEEGKFKFTGKERDEESFYDYFGARYYDARVGRWGGIDPNEQQRIWLSPYNFVQNNPLNSIDPNGLLDKPIYDIDGNFLGTDDEGLQGDAVIMNKENFIQGMSTEAALKYNLGYEGLSGSEAQGKYSSHYNNLPSRPDYDGYLTLDEANDWYRTGNGKSLYTSLEKIDLSKIYSLGENFVGEEAYFNLISNSNNLNDALVYGNIRLKRYPNHQVRAFSDKYDFDYHDWNNLLNLPRNLSTFVGETQAGIGQPYDINLYGSKTLTPIFPGLK